MPAAAREMSRANAGTALRIRKLMLEALEAKLIDALNMDDANARNVVIAEIKSDTLRLLTDSENRGFGTPIQQLRHTGMGGGPLSMIHSAMTPEQAAEAYRQSLEYTPSEEDEE